MRRPLSLPLYALVVITLLLSLVAPVVASQPAPNPCPEGQVYLPGEDICVPEEEAPEEPPDEPVATEVVEEPAGNLASFTLYHLACDNDFQADAVRDAGGVGPTNGCLTFGKPPFSYTVAANGIPITTTTLDATERNYARLDLPSPVPAGTLTITIAPVADYTTELISCALSVGDGFGEIVEPGIAGGSATLTTGPDQDIECWVYNVTRGTGEEDAVVDPGDGQGVVADPPEATGADITIAAYNCPAGTTAANVLLPMCTLPASGLTFSLLTATETVATQVSDAEGDIYFAGVAPNDYGIAATLPTGYGEPIVICYQASPDGNVSEGEQDIVFGNQIRVRVGDGFSVECAWYNIPAQGPDNGPNIFIRALKCGEGIEITSSMSVFDAEQLCFVVYQNKEFRILVGDETIATKQTSDAPLSSGQVFFTKLPPSSSGGYGIEAELDPAEETLGVFCDQDFGDGTFQVVPVTIADGNLIGQVLNEGQTLRCSWFIKINPGLVGTQVVDSPVQEAAPVETGDESTPDATVGQDTTDPVETLTEPQEGQASPAATAGEDELGSEVSWEPGITVRARLCPADVAGQDLDVDLTGDCTEPANGITFEILVDDASTGTYVTDANGEFVIPAELGPGEYLFRHQPAADQLELKTVCSSVYANGSTATGQSRAVGPEMSELYLTHDGASSTMCTFYVVLDSAAPEGQAAPAAGAAEGVLDDEGTVDGAPHSLTLQFWTCPAGADPAADQAALLEACEADSQERSFMLTIDGFATGETVTGPATWEFVEPVIGADIGTALANSAWCSSTWAGGNEDAADVPDTVSLEGGMLAVTVSHPATTVSCDWFLFPE